VAALSARQASQVWVNACLCHDEGKLRVHLIDPLLLDEPGMEALQDVVGLPADEFLRVLLDTVGREKGIALETIGTGDVVLNILTRRGGQFLPPVPG
jgi:hypothetical protein